MNTHLDLKSLIIEMTEVLTATKHLWDTRGLGSDADESVLVYQRIKTVIHHAQQHGFFCMNGREALYFRGVFVLMILILVRVYCMRCL